MPTNEDRIHRLEERMVEMRREVEASSKQSRAAFDRASDAHNAALSVGKRVDELEDTHAKTISSARAIFATVVEDASKAQAAKLEALSSESRAQSASIHALIVQLGKFEQTRTTELKTNRALFVVLAFALTIFVEYCRRT